MRKKAQLTVRTFDGEPAPRLSKYEPIFKQMRELTPGNRVEVMGSPDDQLKIRSALGHRNYRDWRAAPKGYRYSYRLLADRIVITLKPQRTRKGRAL